MSSNNNKPAVNITLGVIPGSVTTTIKEKKGETVKSSKLGNFAVEVYETDETGKTLRHYPLACAYKRFGVENCPSTSRERAIVFAVQLAKARGWNVKAYVLAAYESAVKTLHEKCIKAEASIQKKIDGGEKAFLEAKAENARDAWNNLPDRLKDAKANTANFAAMLPKSRKANKNKKSK